MADGWRVHVQHRIERCWDWLEHWGHGVSRVDLGALDLGELLGLDEVLGRRVRALAEAWDTWW